MSCGDITIKVGASHLWVWVAPEPLAVDTTPTLVVAGPEGAIAGIPALAVVVAPGTVADDGLSPDRRRLTLTEAIAGDRARAAGELWGPAHLITPAGGVVPVRVSEISTDGTVITLADPLPRTITPDGGRIEWATWWVNLTSDDVTAEARADLTWSVSWTPLYAGTADGESGSAYDEGRISVAVRPFDTGLTDRRLRAAYSDLGSTTPGRDNSRAEVISAARDELILEIIPHIRPRGLTIDQLDGVPFRPAHAALTTALIVERAEPDRAERLRERAVTMVDRAIQCAWADLDADGAIDPGESGQRSTISLAATRMSTLFPTTHPRPTAPRWYRGRSH